MVHFSSREPRLSWLQVWQSDDIDFLAHAVGALQLVMDVVCERQIVLEKQTGVVLAEPVEAIRVVLGPARDRLHDAAMKLLSESGQPLDAWHREAVIARLLCPRLALFVVGPEYWIAEQPLGLTDLERQAATSVGARDDTERLATKMKREWQRSLGYGGDRAKPGPKLGSTRPKSAEQRAFEQYVIERNRNRARNYQIAQDAEACRLYRKATGDHAAELTDVTVGRVLRSINS